MSAGWKRLVIAASILAVASAPQAAPVLAHRTAYPDPSRATSVVPHWPGVEAEEPDDTTAPSSRLMTDEEALAMDAGYMAEEWGVELDVAIERVREQARFREHIGALSREYPDTFAGAWTEKDSGHGHFVRFVGEVPGGARARADARGLNVRFIGDARYSLNELSGRAHEVHDDLLAAGYASVVTSYSERDGVVEVYLIVPLGTVDRTKLPDSARGPDVVVEIDEGAPRPDQYPPGHWGPMAVIDEDPVLSLDALLGTGSLRITDSCVTLVRSDGEATLVWRDGQTSWDPRTWTIVFDDFDESMRLSGGERIAVGGGGSELPPWVTEPDPSCPTQRITVHSITLLGR